MKEELARITALTPKQRTDVLLWLCRQAESTRIEIMMSRFHTFHQVKKKYQQKAPFIDYCALIIACKNAGWVAEAKYRSSASLSTNEIKKISRRRISRAKELSRTSTNERLAVHWGKIVELKHQGLGFRKIAQFLSLELRLTVSHTTIWKLWRKWETDG
jgi:hypothetical protein